MQILCLLTTVQTGAFESRSASIPMSSSAPMPLRRVIPKAVTFACFQSVSAARWKNSSSFGFDSG